MTMRNQSWSGDILSSRAIGLLSFMIVAALAYPTVAAPISYVLIPPVTGGGATVVGGFTFDAIGPTLDAVGLSVTGGPQPGSYTVPVSATAAEIVAEIPAQPIEYCSYLTILLEPCQTRSVQ